MGAGAEQVHLIQTLYRATSYWVNGKRENEFDDFRLNKDLNVCSSIDFLDKLFIRKINMPK